MTTTESVFLSVQGILNYIREAQVAVNLKKVTDGLEGVLNEIVESRKMPDEPPMRRIVQITSSPSALYALCEDGSVWGYGSDATWVEYRGILASKDAT